MTKARSTRWSRHLKPTMRNSQTWRELYRAATWMLVTFAGGRWCHRSMRPKQGGGAEYHHLAGTLWPLAGGGGLVFPAVRDVIDTDGDVYECCMCWRRDVGVVGVFKRLGPRP